VAKSPSLRNAWTIRPTNNDMSGNGIDNRHPCP
jgi:hypothetical protein